MLNLHNNLSRRTATNNTTVTQDNHNNQDLAQRLLETDGAKVLPTSDQVGFLPCKHSPDGATTNIRLNGPATHLSTSEGWKAELA